MTNQVNSMKITKKQIIYGALIIALMIPFAAVINAYRFSYAILNSGIEFQPFLSTRIYDVNGELISELFEENRTYVSVDSLPDHVINAFIAAEDKNFYYHNGIDVPGILRALAVDVISGEIRQGGSTITQQIIKQIYTKREKTIKRKLIEILLAREFEKRFSKKKLLEMYVNQIYFGHGVYGLSAASRFYFDTEPDKLTVIQASLLAGIPSSPARNSPLKNPGRSFEKHRQVLYNMVAEGYVSRKNLGERFQGFWKDFSGTSKIRYHTLGVRNRRFDKAPWFTEYIRRILVNRFGEEKVYRSGMQVYTTLNLNYQRIAQDAISESVEKQNKVSEIYNRDQLDEIDLLVIQNEGKGSSAEELKYNKKFMKTIRNDILEETIFAALLCDSSEIEKLFNNVISKYEEILFSSRVEGALISLDPRTGGILTMVGGSDFNSSNQLNRAVQIKRQPGSSFKAFVYGAAIETGSITPATSFIDAPVVYKGTRQTWSPSNYGKDYQGRVLVRKALAASLNIVSVLILEKTGFKKTAEFASQMMRIPISRFEIDPTLALGTTELSPIEMATGFAVYANQGREVIPYAIKQIKDSSNTVIYDGESRLQKIKRKQVVSEETAFIMTSLLRSVVDHGTASGAIRSWAGFRLPAAGKTGTNTDFRDAWFVGYTPDIVTAVWFGCDSQKFTLGKGQSAAVVAAPIWGAFMREVYRDLKISRFPDQPEGIVKRRICGITGDIPQNECPVQIEFFIRGTEPTETCDLNHDTMNSIFELIKRDSEKYKELLESVDE